MPTSLSADGFFAALYRIHALSGELLGVMARAGDNKHVVTAAIVNLVDTWLGAVDLVEASSTASLPACEVRAVRLAMFNASAMMTQKLNRALWARAGNIAYDPYAHVQHKSTWQRLQAERKEQLIDFVSRHPGLSLHQIGEQLQLARYTVQGPMLALQAEGRVRAERRGKRLRRFFVCDVPPKMTGELVDTQAAPCR